MPPTSPRPPETPPSSPTLPPYEQVLTLKNVQATQTLKSPGEAMPLASTQETFGDHPQIAAGVSKLEFKAVSETWVCESFCFSVETR